jgi:hypothetical protein
MIFKVFLLLHLPCPQLQNKVKEHKVLTIFMPFWLSKILTVGFGHFSVFVIPSACGTFFWLVAEI